MQKTSWNKTFTEIRIKQLIKHLFEGNFLLNFTKSKTNGFCWHTNAQFWIKSTKLAPFTNCSSPFYTPGIYAEGYIVFVFPFVRSSVRPFVCSFVRSYFRHVCRICVKVLLQSFSSGVYLSNYLPESIHIWTIVTLEGWHSLYDPEPQGPCPLVGLEVKI